MVERFNGRIADVLKTHRFNSREDMQQTLERYVALYNHQLPQSALGSKTRMQAMKQWHQERPDFSTSGHMIVRDATSHRYRPVAIATQQHTQALLDAARRPRGAGQVLADGTCLTLARTLAHTA